MEEKLKGKSNAIDLESGKLSHGQCTPSHLTEI